MTEGLPNKEHAVDAPIAPLLTILRLLRRATEQCRSMTALCALV